MLSPGRLSPLLSYCRLLVEQQVFNLRQLQSPPPSLLTGRISCCNQRRRRPTRRRQRRPTRRLTRRLVRQRKQLPATPLPLPLSRRTMPSCSHSLSHPSNRYSNGIRVSIQVIHAIVGQPLMWSAPLDNFSVEGHGTPPHIVTALSTRVPTISRWMPSGDGVGL